MYAKKKMWSSLKVLLLTCKSVRKNYGVVVSLADGVNRPHDINISVVKSELSSWKSLFQKFVPVNRER